jgi:hypothetical protein
LHQAIRHTHPQLQGLFYQTAIFARTKDCDAFLGKAILVSQKALHQLLFLGKVRTGVNRKLYMPSHPLKDWFF